MSVSPGSNETWWLQATNDTSAHANENCVSKGQSVAEGSEREAAQTRSQKKIGRSLTILKYQTLGNSYLVFDPRRNGFNEKAFIPPAKWINQICDQDYGIGSNGLLVGPDGSGTGAFEFRIFNSDGSQAQLSGNGARIFGRYLIDAKYIVPSHASGFSITALSRELGRIDIEASPDDLAGSSITTIIGATPCFGPSAVGAIGAVSFGGHNSFTVAALADIGRRSGQGAASWSDSTLLSIGNPHCVTFLPSYLALPSIDLLRQLGSELSFIADAPVAGPANATFRNGCNLQWCFVEDRHRIHLRIVERGEGPTLASGSSAAAVLIAAFIRGLVDDHVTVIMPGGQLKLALAKRGSEIAAVQMSAAVSYIAEIKMADAGGLVPDDSFGRGNGQMV